MPVIRTLKDMLKRVPIAGPLAVKVYSAFAKPVEFETSHQYWVERYQRGGSSGSGSYNRLAQFKADVLNHFVTQKHVASVIEFGCGDGNQLRLFDFPSYLGFDVSPQAIALCRKYETKTRSFKLANNYAGESADLVLSLDVIYHLVEDTTYEQYMNRFLHASQRFVGVYASNHDQVVYGPDGKLSHVRHRKFTDWIDKNAKEFRLLDHIRNRYPFDASNPDETSFADFYFFEKFT